MNKALKRSLFITGGIILAILLTIQIILSCGPLTSIVNKVAAPYVDGSAKVEKVKVSVFRNFPNIRMEARGITVTYPHEKFAGYDDEFFRSGFYADGLGGQEDTLAYVGRFSGSLNLFSLMKGRLDIPKVELSGLRAFAHQYDSTSANWDIIIIPESEDTSSFVMPEFSLGHIDISDPYIVYTAQADTLSACTGAGSMKFKGKLAIEKNRKSRDRVSLDIKGLYAEARLGKDSVSIFSRGMEIFEHKDHIDVEAEAEAELRSAVAGTFKVPVALDSEFGLDALGGGRTGINLMALNASVADIPLYAEGNAVLAGDSTYVDGLAAVKGLVVNDFIREYVAQVIPSATDFSTDAVINMDAEARGWMGGSDGKLPWMKARLEVPEAKFAYEGMFEDGDFDLTLIAENTEDGRISADLEDFCFKIPGIDMNVTGAVDNILAEDPLFKVKAFACTEFADLVDYLPDDSGIDARGDVDFELEGRIRLSQMSIYNFSRSSLKGHIFSDGLYFAMPADTISAFLSHPDIRISTVKNTKESGVGLTAAVDSVRMIAGASTYIMGRNMELLAQNSGDVKVGGGELPPLDAKLKMESLNMMGTDSLMIGIRNSSNNITFRKTAKDKGAQPRIVATSDNRLVFIRSGEHRVTLQNADFAAAAQKRSSQVSSPSGQRGRRDTTRLNRLSALDSLIVRADRKIPDYLAEKDFRAKDFNFELGESIVKMFREWRPSGNLSIGNGNIDTPLLPLRNIISELKGHFTDDEIGISSLSMTSGESDLSAKGSVKGLRDILLGTGRPRIDIDMDMKSKVLNANEFLTALNMAEIQEDSLVISEEAAQNYSLIVVPSNVRASVKLEADSIRYSTISLTGLGGELKMRDRCIQLTNSSATTNVGDISLDGFYSSKTKNDISAGFNVEFSGITSDRIITIFPSIDSLVPMLKSFKGNLDCVMAATTQLDTNMNIIIPTINGIVKMNGSGLELEDTGELRKIAQILMFKDSKVGHIQDMSLNGIISNNQLEIFPFLLGVDRYTLALKGLQPFDKDFKYHVSIIRSPLPFKFGVNFTGNFDDWRYSIGKAQYKSTKIPVFAPQVDTLQVNLVASIKDIFKKGVDAAMRENREARRHVEQYKSEMGYYDDDDDDILLSSEEQDELDSYLLDLECEAESKRIEEEIEAMLAEELAQSTKLLIQNLQNQKK